MTKEKLTCHVCGKVFTSKLYNLNKHLQDFHNERIVSSKGDYIKCLESDCDFTAAQLKHLRKHLVDSHQIDQESETLYFITVADFEQWKAKEEQKSNCRWTKICGSITRSKKDVTIYYCNRSGKKKLVDNINRKRRSRAQGSCKLDCFCTSSIVMTKQSNYVLVDFHKSHYGHSVILNKGDALEDNVGIDAIKDSIAEKLQQISCKVSKTMEYKSLLNVNSQLDHILQLQASDSTSNVNLTSQQKNPLSAPIVNQLIIFNPAKQIYSRNRKILPKLPNEMT